MIKRLVWILMVACGLLIVSALIPCEQERKTHVASSSVEINLSMKEAWQRLSDLTLAHYYVPGLVNTEITTDKKQGLGTSRRVYQSEKRYINETVVDWQEGKGFTVKLHNDDGSAPFPFKEASFTYWIEPVSAQRVRMDTGLHYRMAMGYLGHWVHDWMMASIIQERIDKGAHNLRHFYETGKVQK